MKKLYELNEGQETELKNGSEKELEEFYKQVREAKALNGVNFFGGKKRNKKEPRPIKA